MLQLKNEEETRRGETRRRRSRRSTNPSPDPNPNPNPSPNPNPNAQAGRRRAQGGAGGECAARGGGEEGQDVHEAHRRRLRGLLRQGRADQGRAARGRACGRVGARACIHTCCTV
eukprot:scaffold4467_cov65-Phaeocystis_antarctica.AAC.2